MLARLQGSIAAVEQGMAVIDVGGVGYEVRMPTSDLATLSEGSSVTVHTCLNISQDALTLYGFLNTSSKTLFIQLQKANGIGPKVALSILSTFSPTALAQAVSQSDVSTLAQAPGLGKKGAQKIILELSDKIDLEALDLSSNREPADAATQRIVAGITSLGWQDRDAERAVAQVIQDGNYQSPLQDRDIALVLKAALAVLDRGR